MTTTIESLTHLGVGKTDDGTLVPRVLPGEVIELTEDGYRVTHPVPERIAPVCKHYKSCGGCAMQHASDDFVATWKQDIVHRALSAQGLRAEFRPILTSPPASRRRAKLSGRRTKKGALVGFHAKGSDIIVPVPNCEILVPEITDVIPALEKLTTLVASRKSEVALTLTASNTGLDVYLQSSQPLTQELRTKLAQLVESENIARLTWDDEPIAMRVPPSQTFGTASVTPPPGAFMQATKHGEASLLSAVLDTVSGAKRVVDLFAGCGTFTLPLAEQAEVHAVEGEQAMLTALDSGWRNAKGLKKVTTEARDLFRRPLEPDEFKGFDAVVIDPPRAGAEAQTRTLAKSDIPTVAMVSCNPVTFARDAATLSTAGFNLNWVQVVDQFRWSPHVEIAASFTR